MSLSRRLFNPIKTRMGIFDIPVRVASSKIYGAGLGVFATRNIDRNVILGEYKGVRCSMEDDGDYVLAVQGYLGSKEVEICIDAVDPELSNWTRYINGVKNPEDIQNVKFILGGTFKYPKIQIQTIRDIMKGDELLLDYGPEYW